MTQSPRNGAICAAVGADEDDCATPWMTAVENAHRNRTDAAETASQTGRITRVMRGTPWTIAAQCYLRPLPPIAESSRRHRPAVTAFPVVVTVFGLLALLAPLGAAEEPLGRVGALLAVGGGLQFLHGVRRADAAALRRAVSGAVISILMGLFVLAAPDTAAAALALFMAVTFGVDGLGYLRSSLRASGRPRLLAGAAAAADFATAAVLLWFWRSADVWLV